jgi:hypothetical protein
MRHGVGLAPVILLLVANVWCYKVCGSEPHFAVRTEDIVMLIIVFRSSLARREKRTKEQNTGRIDGLKPQQMPHLASVLLQGRKSANISY